MCPAMRFLATLIGFLFGDAVDDEIERAVMTHIVGKFAIEIARCGNGTSAEGHACRHRDAFASRQHSARHHGVGGGESHLGTDRIAGKALCCERWTTTLGLTSKYEQRRL